MFLAWLKLSIVSKERDAETNIINGSEREM